MIDLLSATELERSVFYYLEPICEFVHEVTERIKSLEKRVDSNNRKSIARDVWLRRDKEAGVDCRNELTGKIERLDSVIITAFHIIGDHTIAVRKLESELKIVKGLLCSIAKATKQGFEEINQQRLVSKEEIDKLEKAFSKLKIN